MGESIIQVEDLYKSYGDVKAVRGVSFAVHQRGVRVEIASRQKQG